MTEVWVATVIYPKAKGVIGMENAVFSSDVTARKWATARRDEYRAKGMFASQTLDLHTVDEPDVRKLLGDQTKRVSTELAKVA